MLSRRRVIESLALLGVAGAAPLRAAPASAPAPFIPPETPQILARELARELGDGNRLVVRRSWMIGFAPRAGGYRVEGRQVAVSVDAPTHLAPIAEIERSREETSFLPLDLDAQGEILAGGAKANHAAVDEAIAAALDIVARGAASPREVDQARHFLAGLQGSAAQLLSAVPADLFRPREPQWETRRSLTLEGGIEGEVAVRFEASSDPHTGLLREARRAIVTRVANGQRSASEHWTLAPA